MGVNFVQAASRSHADAETLYGASRLGTADHLFGLAAECAIKAVLVGLGVIPKGASPDSHSGFKVHINELWP